MHLATQPFTSGVQKRFKLITGMYTEILPEGGEFGVWTKEGGAPRGEAQWYHVRCYTLGGGGENDTRGGQMPPPPPPPP